MTALFRLRGRRRGLSRLGRFRIWTIDLYVVRQFIQAYAVCLVSFVGLFVLVEAFSKLDRFLRQDAPLISTLVRYHVAIVPTVYAQYLGPVLTLAAGMFTLTALNRQNELTPLKTAGVSVHRVMAPVFVLTAALMAAGFAIKDQVLPLYRDQIRQALSLARGRPLRPPPYYDAQNELLIRVREYSPTSKIGQGVEVSKLHPNGKAAMQLDANRIVWVPSGTGSTERGKWVLSGGSIQRWDEFGNLIVNASASKFDRLKESFKEMDLQTNLLPIDLEASDAEISYLSWKDLKRQYQRQPYHRHLAVKLHHHFAFPLAHIVLLFLGLPFVLKVQPASKVLSLAASFAICGAFFIFSSVCASIANQSEHLSPTLAAWLPIMLFGSLGITFFDRLPT